MKLEINSAGSPSTTMGVDAFLADYEIRNPKSATFAKYALGHVKRILGRVMAVDISRYDQGLPDRSA
jgi:hypothetical protein